MRFSIPLIIGIRIKQLIEYLENEKKKVKWVVQDLPAGNFFHKSNLEVQVLAQIAIERRQRLKNFGEEQSKLKEYIRAHFFFLLLFLLFLVSISIFNLSNLF